jgi:hypothetical protein
MEALSNVSMFNGSYLAFAGSPYIGSTWTSRSVCPYIGSTRTSRSVCIHFHVNVCQQAVAYQWVSSQSFSDLSIPIFRCCVTLYLHDCPLLYVRNMVWIRKCVQGQGRSAVF